MARRKGNIVLLTGNSREADSKRSTFATAAARLGLEVRDAPDRQTRAILPCSDSQALDAAFAARRHGIPGPAPAAIDVAFSKPLVYEFARERGFGVLPWFVPLAEQDLRTRFAGPVIVKPERGSGSIPVFPWAYRKFSSVQAFARFLARGKLMEQFFRYQSDPRSWGRYLVMEYVPGTLYTVAAAVNAKRARLYDTNAMRVHGDNMVVDWMLLGARHRDTPRILDLVQALAGFGLTHSVVGVQCVEKRGRLYPIDFNLRPGTMWARFHQVTGSAALERILGYIVGLERDPAVALPAPYVGIRRMKVPLRAGRRKVRFGGGAIPLIDEYRYDPAKPYDLGFAYPIFAVPCRHPREFEPRARRVIRGTKLFAPDADTKFQDGALFRKGPAA